MEWLDAHLNKVCGYRSGASVSGVIEILDEDGDLAFRRLVAVLFVIKLLRILERPDQQRGKIFVLRRVVGDPEMPGFLGVKTRLGLCRKAAGQQGAKKQRANTANGSESFYGLLSPPSDFESISRSPNICKLRAGPAKAPSPQKRRLFHTRLCQFKVTVAEPQKPSDFSPRKSHFDKSPKEVGATAEAV
jgi:hypothetical protein